MPESRIEGMIQSQELGPILQPGGEKALGTAVTDFLIDPTVTVLRISLKHLSFTHSAREIVANAIDRDLLTRARGNDFKRKPVVVFLDEAHQFLDKQPGDEYSRFPLDAFDLMISLQRKVASMDSRSVFRPSAHGISPKAFSARWER